MEGCFGKCAVAGFVVYQWRLKVACVMDIEEAVGRDVTAVRGRREVVQYW